MRALRQVANVEMKGNYTDTRHKRAPAMGLESEGCVVREFIPTRVRNARQRGIADLAEEAVCCGGYDTEGVFGESCFGI